MALVSAFSLRPRVRPVLFSSGFRFFPLSFLPLVAFFSCGTSELSKEMAFEEYKGVWGVPLGTRTETFLGFTGDFFTDNMQPVVQGTDNPKDIIYYRYEIEGERHIIDELVRIPNFSNSFTIRQGGEILGLPILQDPISRELEDVEGGDAVKHSAFPMLTHGVRLDAFVFETGHLALTLEFVYHADLEIEFRMPGLISPDGQPLERRFEFLYENTKGAPITRRLLLPLHGYTFNVDTDVDRQQIFQLDASWRIVPKLNVAIPGDDYFRMSYRVEIEKVREARGFFGAMRRVFIFGRDVAVMYAEKARELDFSHADFKDMFLSVELSNPHKIPMALDAQQIRFLNVDLEEVLLTPRRDKLIPLDFAREAGDPPQETIFYFDRASANIDEILEHNALYAIKMPIVTLVNPAEPHPQERNNLVLREPIRVRVRFDVPFNIIFNDMTKTFEYDNDLAESAENFDTITLRFLTKNEIPMQGHLNLHFVDAAGARIYSAKERVLFGPPQVNGKGEVVSPYEGLDEITLDGAGTNALVRTEKIQVEVVMNTAAYRKEKRFVLFERKQEVEVTVSARAGLALDLSE